MAKTLGTDNIEATMNGANGINGTNGINGPNGLSEINGNVNAEIAEIEIEGGEGETERRERKGVIYQVLMSLCANVSVLGPAMGFGYSAIALGPLMAPTSDLKIDEHQANWIATAAALGTPIGCVISSFVMRRGRRISLVVTSVLSIVGWLTIYMSDNYEEIIVGRVISGIATGLASVPATVYSAEVAGPKWRGTMVTWTSIAIALGVLIVYVFGYIFKDNWRLVALMCTIAPILSIALTLIAMPESPIWLRDRGRIEEATVVLKKFRGIPSDCTPPADVLLELRPRHQRKKQNILKHLRRRNAVIPFVIMLSYFFFQQFSGIFVVVYYAVDIIESAGITIDPYLGAVLIGLTRLIGSFLVAGVSSKYGRRIPSIASGAGMTIFMGLLSIYLIMEDRGCDIQDGGIIPVVCVLAYIFMSTIGFLVIPFAMIGEIYPTKVKDLLTGMTTCIGYIFSSITVKTYSDMLEVMGKHGVFFFYAVISLAGTVFVTLCLPETKGKTLHEIEDIFVKHKKPEDGCQKEMIALKEASES